MKSFTKIYIIGKQEDYGVIPSVPINPVLVLILVLKD